MAQLHVIFTNCSYLNFLFRLTPRCARQFSKDLEWSAQRLPKVSVTPLPPLSEPMQDLPPVVFSTAKAEDTVTEVTVLSNGLRVASEKKFGQFCTAGGMFFMNNPRLSIFFV